ncbi:Lcl C-terminal domain-containing protein [Stutzerimonas kunmingensis]|uniref:Lcl C-terminal domain-containing protein n=1 Tax=Stutzerimonas kunmingensis TaxID=1211807 RepID=UPI00241C921B|nr:DUF1566 domain-containing protein [Stutzerimonas kunmingensis]
MAAPIITPIPTPPIRSDAPADFAAKADAFAASLPQFVTETNASAAFLDQRAIDADASAQAAAASEAAVEADRAEVANNTQAVADNTQTVVERADEVADNALQVAADTQQVAEDKAAVDAALASVAGGPVISINGKTGVVTLGQVSLDGPSSLYITQSAEFDISDFDVFTDYAVQASAGAVSISGSTISYTAPNVAGPVTLSVFAGGYQRDIVLEILPDRPAAPVITSPAATGVMDNPTLSTGPFALIGPNADTHAATDWEIWTGAGRTGTLKWSSLNNAANKLSITATGAGLAVSTQYHLLVRHVGTTFGAGEWAEFAFTTAAQFLPTVIGQAFAGGFYAGKIKVGADTFVLIAAPKSAETSLAWKPASTSTAGTASQNDGLANSNAMNDAAHPAAQYCRAYSGGGFSDWYLPAKDEFEVCYRNLKPDATANNTSSGANTNSVPAASNYTAGSPAQTTAAAFKTGGAEAFTVPTYYWTSTEDGVNTAWSQGFSDGSQSGGTKSGGRPVRPVRRIKI